ncbi:hypothetical protein DVK85_01285 [Flavobacterium arcticum]|uniref:Uncharacterized protein n=1 Tax=Flavobacterium arcticum TaxID=1784713 RepID=A0A345H8M5_9FLAO|nr:hypothetical protein [Flavobacterium arcticum]AXG72935.1 hypothetical protein DVK85_01285 [Flavobacterium arcticum]KAF2510401.1 hypothetical protein E0W72_07920 [Flavobacterium arcticum]
MSVAEILNYILGGTSLASAYVAWVSRKSQVQLAETNVLVKMQAAYKTFVADQQKEYEELKKEFELVKKKLAEYESKCKHCNNL